MKETRTRRVGDYVAPDYRRTESIADGSCADICVTRIPDDEAGLLFLDALDRAASFRRFGEDVERA